MMENIDIFNKLKALGIEDISQLEKGNIQYWWNEKYKQIIASNIKLKTNPLSDEIIKINLVKEELQQLEIEDLKSILEEGKHNQIWQKNYTEIEKNDLENDEKLRRDKKWRNVPCIGVLTSNCVSKIPLTRAKWDLPLSGFITEKEIFV